ncbi:MAG TPA: SulP family inorganic anion transporter [Gaiellaceae bacterium]|nr:SulP family inorganic anion transporter [Gaiellaceae bacterium]
MRQGATDLRVALGKRQLEAGDLVAGVTVALVLVPQSLAYAQLAGMPAYRGLYAAALPPLAAALIASSPHLQTGPVALTSLLTFGALASLAPPGSDEYVALGILLALLVGVVRVLVGLLRAGVVAYLISQPMLLGFVPAAAILIVAAQLPAVLGTSPERDGILERAFRAIGDPASWDGASVVLGVGTVVVMTAGRSVHRLFPATLVAVVFAIAFSRITDYDGSTVGPIPAGLPPFSLDFEWQELPVLVVPAAIIALVGFVEPSSIARTFAARDRRRWNANREFESQGVANIAAAVSGGFPVGGSFSRSALNRLSGARTRLSGAITGLAVLVFLPFSDVLSRLPTAVLGGIVIGAVLGLIRPLPVLRLAAISRPQFLVAGTTFVLTLALAPHVEWAVIAGIALAVGVHLWRELSLEVPSWVEDDVLHMRPRGVLWFGAAARLEDRFLQLVADHRGIGQLVVHLDGLGRIDTSGALALRVLLHQAREAGLEVEIVDVRPRWRKLVARVIEREDDPLRL